MTDTLWVDNNNVIELGNTENGGTALTNSVTGAIDTGASVTVTLKDSSGVDVLGMVWPAPMTHDSGGLYRATLDESLEIIRGATYTACIDAVGSSDEVGHWECSAVAKTRACT